MTRRGFLRWLPMLPLAAPVVAKAVEAAPVAPTYQPMAYGAGFATLTAGNSVTYWIHADAVDTFGGSWRVMERRADGEVGSEGWTTEAAARRDLQAKLMGDIGPDHDEDWRGWYERRQRISGEDG